MLRRLKRLLRILETVHWLGTVLNLLLPFAPRAKVNWVLFIGSNCSDDDLQG